MLYLFKDGTVLNAYTSDDEIDEGYDCMVGYTYLDQENCEIDGGLFEFNASDYFGEVENRLDFAIDFTNKQFLEDLFEYAGVKDYSDYKIIVFNDYGEDFDEWEDFVEEARANYDNLPTVAEMQ